MFHFTPLLGAQCDSPAVQSLLALDNGIKILIDVGWDSSFSPALLAALAHHAPSLDLVLLTHPTLAHMGAYAHACKHIVGFAAIPVYSTFPVSNLGRLLLQDLYLSTPAAATPLFDESNVDQKTPKAQNFSPTIYLPPAETGDLPKDALKLPPTPAEIDSYCSKIFTLKYSQPTPLGTAASRVAGKLGSVTITAYSAGHSLGGTIWKIQQAQESIVYAVDWNISRENCLRGAAFLGGEGGRIVDALLKPTALVCSAKNASITNIAGGRKKRDDLLLDAIKKTAVERGGTVLIPVDSVGRVLELVYVLEHAWRKDPTLSGRGGGGRGIALHLAGRKVKRLSQIVGSMLEWMDEGVVKEFESIGGGEKGNRRRQGDDSGNKAGPFDFLHLNLISSPHQLSRVLHSENRGKVILASDASLDWGFSRDAILKLADDEKNLIVMTERAEGQSGLAGQIWQSWKDSTGDADDRAALGQVVPLAAEYPLELVHRQHLAGEELLAYQRHLIAQQALTSQHHSLISPLGLPAADAEEDDVSSSSDSDSDSERQGKALTTAASKKVSAATVMMGGSTPAGEVDIGVNILLRGKGIYDYDVRGAKGRNRMFPFVMRRRRVDEYGEVIRPEDYMRAEERADEDGATADAAATATEPTPTDRELGKKRKWDDNVSARRGSKPGPGGSGGGSGGSADGTGKRRKRTRRGGRGRNRNRDRDRNDRSSGGDGGPTTGEDTGDDTGSSASEGEDEEEALATPAKLTRNTLTLTLRLSATYIDFAGLHDQKGLRMLLPLIDPKKLILTAGRASEVAYLADFCRDKAALGGRDTDVLVPPNGTVVDGSVDTNAWLLKLANPLVRALKWQHVRGLGVVHVIGRVGIEAAVADADADADADATTTTKKLTPAPEEDGETKDLSIITTTAAAKTMTLAVAAAPPPPPPVLDLLPPALAAATRTHAPPIHVGDIRLADLRRVLLAEGHVAEFRGEGTLLVDHTVVVRKTGVGNVTVEDGGYGTASFGLVRRKVYEGLAVVAGG